jgi:hypothetical protein
LALPAATGAVSTFTGDNTPMPFLAAELNIFLNNQSASNGVGDNQIVYDDNTSDAALQRLLANEVDFAMVIPLIMRQDLLDTATALDEVSLFPLFWISLVPVHSLPLQPSDPPLVMTPDVIADIHSTVIRYWDDPVKLQLDLLVLLFIRIHCADQRSLRSILFGRAQPISPYNITACVPTGFAKLIKMRCTCNFCQLSTSTILSPNSPQIIRLPLTRLGLGSISRISILLLMIFRVCIWMRLGWLRLRAYVDCVQRSQSPFYWPKFLTGSALFLTQTLSLSQ